MNKMLVTFELLTKEKNFNYFFNLNQSIYAFILIKRLDSYRIFSGMPVPIKHLLHRLCDRQVVGIE